METSTLKKAEILHQQLWIHTGYNLKMMLQMLA